MWCHKNFPTVLRTFLLKKYVNCKIIFISMLISCAIFKWLGQGKSWSLNIGWLHPLYINLEISCDSLWFFQWSCMDVRVGLWRKLRAEELMLLNCGVGEDSWESLGLQGDNNQSILKYIQPVHSKGDQPWVFFGRTDAKAETLVLWPPHAKSWLIGKDSDARRDWGQEEKGMTEDEMAGWHHRLNGCDFEWTLGVGDGQGGLACCNSWGRKELDMTERLNWTELWFTNNTGWQNTYIHVCVCIYIFVYQMQNKNDWLPVLLSELKNLSFVPWSKLTSSSRKLAFTQGKMKTA